MDIDDPGRGVTVITLYKSIGHRVARRETTRYWNKSLVLKVPFVCASISRRTSGMVMRSWDRAVGDDLHGRLAEN